MKKRKKEEAANNVLAIIGGKYFVFHSNLNELEGKVKVFVVT